MKAPAATEAAPRPLSPATFLDTPVDIYARHGRAVARFVGRALGQTADAEDIIQETFVVALQSWSRFRGESAERTWMIGIANNLIRAYLRRAAREPQATDETRLQASDARGWPQLVARERLRLLDATLDGFSDAAREVARLVLVQGLKQREAAEVLGMAENTVASHVARSRQRLRDIVRQADEVHHER